MFKTLQKRKQSKEQHGTGPYRQPGPFDKPGKLPWKNRAVAKIRETSKRAKLWTVRNIGIPIALATASMKVSATPMVECEVTNDVYVQKFKS